MQAHEQAQFLGAVGEFVREQVSSATQPLLAIIDGLQKQIGELDRKLADSPRAGADGRDGANGKDADMNEVQRMIDAADIGLREFFERTIAALPKPERGEKGETGPKGDQGPAGEKGESIAGPQGERGLKGDPGESGKDGTDGRNGADGKAVSPDEISVLVADAVAQLPVPLHVVGGHIDRDGDLHHVLSNGTQLSLGKVVGRDGVDGKDGRDGRDGNDAKGEPGQDGKDGRDGRDGLGFKDMSVTFDGERDFIFKFVLDERIEELSITVPFMIYRGVWKAGSYRRGDCVTRDGSMFVAREDTDRQPGVAESGWQLATKRGRDGKDGDKGDQGPPGLQGLPGRNGMDLTQIGLDGKKWG